MWVLDVPSNPSRPQRLELKITTSALVNQAMIAFSEGIVLTSLMFFFCLYALLPNPKSRSWDDWDEWDDSLAFLGCGDIWEVGKLMS